MPLDELHQRVASIALRAASEHGFALGGGNALIAHGLIDRPTQDVDLFTDQEHGVEAASGAVEAALSEAGFQPERRDKTGGLGDIFYGMGQGLAEWFVTGGGGEQMFLQMAYFERGRAPVVMEFGPVLDLEDAIGGKVCALASRAYERDYLDTAAALERYTPGQLISFARRLDPGLEGEDFADAAQRLDRTPDEAFTDLGLSEADVTALRERFAGWPREAETRSQEQSAGRDGGQGEEVNSAQPEAAEEVASPQRTGQEEFAATDRRGERSMTYGQDRGFQQYRYERGAVAGPGPEAYVSGPRDPEPEAEI